MPLHMRQGYTVRMVKLLKIKAKVPSIWAKGCMFDDCVCYLILHEYPSLMEGESRGILLLFYHSHSVWLLEMGNSCTSDFPNTREWEQ